MIPHSYGDIRIFFTAIWPNLISLARMLVTPLIMWCILNNKMQIAFYLSVGAGLSDLIDGLVARLLKATSTLGAYLDPLADKVLLVGLYVVLAYKGIIPGWLTLLVVSRDGLILGGCLLTYILGQTLRIKPVLISKVNTFLQIVLLALALANIAFNLNCSGVLEVLSYGVAATTIASMFIYVFIWMNQFV